MTDKPAQAPAAAPIGRPKKAPSEKRRAHRLGLNLTEAEKAELVAGAAAAAMPLQDFIRAALFGATQRQPRKPDAAIAALGVPALSSLIRIGNNLNQLARAANRGVFGFSDVADLDGLVKEISDFIEEARQRVR